MPDKKLTDTEIIKALECCADEMGCTKGCPCFNQNAKGSHCTVSKKLELEKLTIDLVNRQKAEIEFLKEQRDRYMQDATDFSIKVEQLKTENELLKLNVGDSK